MLGDLKRKATYAWCDRMKLKKSEKAKLVEMILETPKVLRKIEETARMKNSEIYNLLHPLTAESLIFMYAMSSNLRAQKRIHVYLSSLRGVKLSVDGRTLRKMGFPPSPVYNTVLKDLLAAKLDGKVGTTEAEVQFVVKRFAHYGEERKK